MADIPLFPAGNIGLPLQGAAPFPVENLDPRLYSEGYKAGLEQPSTFSSVVSGLKEGIAFGDELANNATKRRIGEAQAAGHELDNQLAPEKLEVERKQAEAQLRAYETQKLTADIKYREAEQESELYTQSLQKKKIVQDSFATVRKGNLEEGIGLLEENFLDLAQVGLPYSGKEGEGSKLAPDPSVIAGLNDLVYRAQKTKDPEVIARAQGLVDRFNSVASSQTSALAGRPIGGSSTTVSLDPELDFLKGQGVALPDPVTAAAQAEDKPTGASATPAVPARQGPPNILFPESVGTQPAFVEGKDEFAGVPPEQQPISKQLSGKGEGGLFEKEIKARMDDLIEAGLTPKQAQDAALKEAKANQLTDKRQQYIDTLAQTASNFRQNTRRGQLALERLQELKKQNPNMELALGPTTTWSKVTNYVLGQAGNPKSRELLDNIKADLAAVSASGLFDLAQEYGFGTQAYNTSEEQELIKSIGVPADATIERYISAMQLSGAKAEEADQMREIISVARQRGYTFEAAKRLADNYRLANPATVMGIIEGKSFLVHNGQKQNVHRWLDERLGWDKYIDRDPSGRITNAPAADTSSLLKKMSGGKPESVDHLSVAEYQPNGVTEATLMRIASIESTGVPTAEGQPTRHGTAKGLFQFLDRTGAEEWKKAGFKTDYDPKDPEKATIMMKSRMDRLLRVFHGDIRLALAANNAGEGTIGEILEARNLAGEKQKDTSWEVVKHYLPKPEETVPYVERIMGEGKPLPGLRQFTTTEMHAVLAGLSTTKGQQNARAFLSPDGMETLASVKDIKNASEIAGTWMEEPLNFLLSLNPLAATEAQAEEPAGSAAKPAKPQTAEGAPSADSDQNMVQRGITNAADAIRSVIPDELQSTVLGLARSAMWGLDDEAGAVVRHMVLGEPMDQAYVNSRAQKKLFQEKNPWLYTTGEVIGGVQAGGLAVRGAAKVFGAEAVKNMGMKGLTAMGAGTGAAMGFTEGEGGVENRALNAVRGGVGGTVMGAATKPVIAGATAIARPFASVISTLYGKFKGQAGPQKFNKAESEILGRLGSISEQETAKVSSDLRATSNPAASALDELPPTKLRQFVDMAAKDPDVSDDLLREARQRLDDQPARVDTLFAPHAKVSTDPESAARTAAQTISGKVQQLKNERASLGDVDYNKARATLPTKVKTLAEPDVVAAGIQPNEVPVFKSKAVLTAMKDPEVKSAIRTAAEAVDKDGVQPPNSFDILHEAKRQLADRLKGAAGKEKTNIKAAHERLRTAMHEESLDYQRADAVFANKTDQFNEFRGKAIRELEKFAETGEVKDVKKFGTKLFGLDRLTLRNLMKDLDPTEQQTIKDAAAAHLKNTVDFRGTGSANAGQAFPDFTKNDIPGKLEAIFGKSAAKELVDGLKQERRIAITSGTILNQGAQTAQRAAESVRAARSQAGSQIAQAFGALGVGAISGSSYGMAGSASFAVYKTTQALRSYLESAQVANKVKMADEISNILVRDKDQAIQLFDKITTHLKAQKQNDALKLWNSAVKIAKEKSGVAASAAGQAIGGYGEDYKPDTQAAEMPHLHIRY